MYAPIDRVNYPQELALKVNKIQWFEKELRGHNANYQVGMERRVMGDLDEAEYRYIVLKWEKRSVVGATTTYDKRRVLLETSDPDQVIATLKMLLSIEREPK
jgi:tricorn protease-like protein